MPEGRYTYPYPRPMVVVDALVFTVRDGRLDLLLIERGHEPFKGMWALPGGFVDYGESLEAAALREAREETGLAVTLSGQFHTYSDPDRDPRQHTITTVFVAVGDGTPRAADDARHLGIFAPSQLPEVLAFDHKRILADYLKVRPQWLTKIKKTY